MLAFVLSPTQRAFSRADVDAAVATCLPGRRVQNATMLTGGSFGTVWSVTLDTAEIILKVGPDPAARLLRYEAGMLESEAAYLQLVGSLAPLVPTPRLLARTDDYVFMTKIPGQAMPDLPAGTNTRPARWASGVAIARLHEIKGEFFGYAGPRARASSWPDAYRAMIEALFADAVDWNLTLPVDPDRVRAAIAASHDALATVHEPVLVHFDLWDGNVITTVDERGNAQLTGLVDGERYLFGDPLIDFASPALFRDIFDDPDEPFVAGYQSVRPFAVDEMVRRRTWAAQLYLYLVMLVEFPSRGMDPAGADRPRWAVLTRLVTDLLARLTRHAPGHD